VPGLTGPGWAVPVGAVPGGAAGCRPR